MQEPFIFSEFTKSSIPENGGLYVLLGHPHLGKYPVLYVGQANDLRRRFGEHLNSDDLRIQRDVFFYDYELQPNGLLRNKREKELIQLYNPPFNVMLKPKLLPNPLTPKLQQTLPVSPFKQKARSPLSDLLDEMNRQKKQQELELKLRTEALLNALKKFS